ncbi:hypothetical protein FB446DRAFT_365520 [Lentinula raphanica]|nr:hypothetical protein FB446DRAFT_365520 [Lentinula raphanica]
MSFLFSRSNSNLSSSETELSPYPPYSANTLSTLLHSLPTDDSGSFVGTVLPTTTSSSSQSFSSSSPGSQGRTPYGYLSSYPTLILGLNDLHELVHLVSTYLDVETPFVFSNGGTTADSGVPIAIDLDAGRVKRLIEKYVGYLTAKSSSNGKRGQPVPDFDDEARFAGPHELGMLLRWGLARVVRIESSSSSLQQPTDAPPTRALTRGLIPYLAYLNWAKQESSFRYPSSHFGGLLDTRTRTSVPVRVRDEFGMEEVVFRDEYKEVVPPLLRETLLTLFALLAKLVAHSAKSGATPPGLSPLFGPLLFGLGPLPSDLLSSSSSSTPDPTSFESTYTAYLRSVHATEHCLLAFIRWQDTPASQGGGGFGGVGGVPGRLKEWIKDYPRTLSGHSRVLAIADLLQSGGRRSKEQHSLGPRKGVKTVRVLAVRRTVPAYDADLVRSSARWGLPSYAATGGAGLSQNSLPGNKEWARISPPVQGNPDAGKGGRMPAKYSESYRKKMNIPPGVEPGSSPYAPPLSSLSSSSSSYSSYSSYTSSPLTRSTSATSTYSLSDPNSPISSSSPTSPSTSSAHPSSQQSRFKTLSDAHWGEFESSGFLSPPSSLLSTRGAKDIDQALKFDLTESARKARTAKRERGSVNWGDFVNGGFDMSDGSRKPLTLSTTSTRFDYGSSFTNNASDLDKNYVGADGRLKDVGDFALDTGLNIALQFNLNEFGIIGGSTTGKGGERPKTAEGKGERGERERSITGVSLGKRLKKKEKPLPPFTYDSTPLLLPGSETLIESAFVDVWTDLVSWGFAELGLSSGSAGTLSLLGDLVFGMALSSATNVKAMTLSRSISRDDDAPDEGERLEKAKWRSELFKECNWVLVEFKALPSTAQSVTSANSKDPRISTTLLLFEEYVPRDYRAQLGHQLAGIHTSFILNPAYTHHPFSILTGTSLSTLTSYPNQTSSIARTRLGSLFSSPGNAGASSSTLGLNDSGRGKKDKAVKDAKKRKEKKEKKDKEKSLAPSFFTGSTRTITNSTPTPYNNSKDRWLQPSTLDPSYSRAGQVDTPDSPLTPTGPGPNPNPRTTPVTAKGKLEAFDEMLADGNRGTKVLTLNGALHTLGPEPGLSSDVEVTDGEPEEEIGLSVDTHLTAPNQQTQGQDSGSSHTVPLPPDSYPQTQDSASTPIRSIFRLGPTSTSSPKSTPKSTPKPKGPKPKTSKRQSRQNLVPAEYHTVEFETRLTGLASGGESDDLDTGKEDETAFDARRDGRDDIEGTTTGDGFLEEAARRRRAARLAEREKLRSQRRGKRFSIGLGGKSGIDDDDDEAWVDIVVPGYGAHRGPGGEADSSRGDPEEASQEVARVLSAVRGGQPYPGMDDESLLEGQTDGAGKIHSDSDDIEVQTVPRFGKGKEDGNGYHETLSYTSGDLDTSYTSGDYPDGEDADLAPSVPRRRLGYFDLHPERRRASQELLKQAADAQDELLDVHQPEAMSSLEADMFASGGHNHFDEDIEHVDLDRSDESGDEEHSDEDDPRARYAHGSDDEHDGAPKDLDKIYAARTDVARPLPTLPPRNGSIPPQSGPSSTSPPPRSSSLPLSSSPPVLPPKATVVPPSSTTPTKPSSLPTPTKSSVLTSTLGSTSGTPGKTAALIEMYREKEKKSLPSSPASPPGGVTHSKIPVSSATASSAIPKLRECFSR